MKKLWALLLAFLFGCEEYYPHYDKAKNPDTHIKFCRENRIGEIVYQFIVPNKMTAKEVKEYFNRWDIYSDEDNDFDDKNVFVVNKKRVEYPNSTTFLEGDTVYITAIPKKGRLRIRKENNITEIVMSVDEKKLPTILNNIHSLGLAAGLNVNKYKEIKIKIDNYSLNEIEEIVSMLPNKKKEKRKKYLESRRGIKIIFYE